MLTVDPQRLVDPLTVKVLAMIGATAERNAVPYFVCGAMARDILIWHVYGVPVPTATRDIDLAFSLPDWDSFTALKAQLTASGEFVADPHNQGSVRLVASDGTAGYPVDLIPFGGIATTTGAIAWPPEGVEIMSVVGYEDALASAVVVAITPALDVPVLSLPMLAILKLITWSERSTHTSKDAGDLSLLLNEYARLGNTQRLYDKALALLEEVGFDLELGGAKLLGRDAAAASNARTISAVREILAAPRLRDTLTTAVAASMRGRAGAVETATVLLKQFEAGLESTPG